jgi:hypothetical protein
MDDITKKFNLTGLWNSNLNGNPEPEKDGVNKFNDQEPIDFSLQSLAQDEFRKFDSGDLAFLRASLSPSLESETKQVRSSNQIIKALFRRINRTKSIEVLRVINVCQRDLKSFQWGWVNPPRQGDEFYGSTLIIGGWIVGRDSQPTAIRALFNQAVIAETQVNIPRPDVAKSHFFQYPNCGYQVSSDLSFLPHKVEIILEAVFPEGHTAVAGSVLLRKYG